MLTQLSALLGPKKFADLQSRVAHRDTKTALAAEAELAVLWAISQVAHLAPEPALPHSNSRPEAASNDLFRSGAAVIEVRALSDDSFSGKEAMDRTANIIAGYADRLRKGAGKHLFFEFNERSYWDKRFHRERCVDPEFELNEDLKEGLRRWITAPDWPNPAQVRLTEGKTDVVIVWRQSTSRFFRTFCRMPAVAYDLEDNPIYKALRSKSAQVKGAAQGTLRCVVLVDAGCRMLRTLRPMSAIHEVGGSAIIDHALRKLSLDAVIVLSPLRENSGLYAHFSRLLWNVTCFDRRQNLAEGEYDRVKEMAAQLPRPHFEGYQARDIHRQGGFAPDRIRYLPTQTITSGFKMTIKISAGLLHEYLSGRIDAEKFRSEAFGNDKNYFELQLASGNSICQAHFEAGGVDEDDDYVVFDLDLDLAKFAHKAGDPQ